MKSIALMILLALLGAGAAPAGAKTNMWQIQEMALAYNPLLRRALAQVSAGRAPLLQSRSGYWPRVLGDASWTRSKTETESGGSSKRTTSRLGLDLNQTLFDWSLYGLSAAAKSELAADRHDLQTVRLLVVLAARRAYFSVLENQELVRVARQNLALTQKTLSQVMAYRRQGLRTKVDLARARRDVATAQLELVRARASARRARVDLALAVGKPQAGDLALAGPTPLRLKPRVLRFGALRRLAFTARPEVLRLQALINAAYSRLQVAQGGHYPVVSLRAGAGRTGSNDLDRQFYDYGLALDLPLFTGFLVRGQVKERKALIRQVKAELARTRDEVRSEVDRALLTVYEAAEEVKLGRAVVSWRRRITGWRRPATGAVWAFPWSSARPG